MKNMATVEEMMAKARATLSETMLQKPSQSIPQEQVLVTELEDSL